MDFEDFGVKFLTKHFEGFGINLTMHFEGFSIKFLLSNFKGLGIQVSTK
jgi:hypothetical protein